MWNKDTVIGIASNFIGIGGGAMLAFLGQTIWAWILATIFIIGGIIFLIYGLKKSKRERQTKIKEPEVKITAKIASIEPYSYYDEAFSGNTNHSRNNLKITLAVSFELLSPIKIEILELIANGQVFKPEKIDKRLIRTSETLQFVFSVPKTTAITWQNVKIIVFADNTKWESDPFNIDFGV